VRHTGIDKRTVRTKLLLCEALLALLKSKKVGEISVHELCEKAKINRGSFYKYYNNVPDMLAKIEKELFVQYEKLFTEVTALSTPDFFVYECLKLVKENAVVCRMLLAAEAYGFIRKIALLVHDSTTEYWRTQFGITDEKALERVYTFVSHGIIGIIEEWVKNDFDTTPLDLAGTINEMSDSCVDVFIAKK